MRSLFLLLTLSIAAIAHAQINWINFDSVKLFPQNDYVFAFPPDTNFEDDDFWENEEWMIILGREVRPGVYVMLDEQRQNTGSLIQIKESGLSGLWGWLMLHYTNAEKPDRPAYKDYPRYFHTRRYTLMLNPISP